MPFKIPILKMKINETRKVKLPEGYTLMSLEEEDDPYERGKAKMLSLGGRYPPSKLLLPRY